MKSSRRLASAITILLIICSPMLRCESPEEEAENSEVIDALQDLFLLFDLQLALPYVVDNLYRFLQRSQQHVSTHKHFCSTQTSTRRPLYPPTTVRTYVCGGYESQS